MAQPHTTVANIVTREPVRSMSDPRGDSPALPLRTPISSTNAPPARSPITLYTALLSSLRLWFLYRDDALWTFCSGVEAADPLEAMDFTQAADPCGQANAMRAQCLSLAKQISEEGTGTGDVRTSAAVLRGAIDDLLTTDSPKFLLAVPHIPGSF